MIPVRIRENYFYNYPYVVVKPYADMRDYIGWLCVNAGEIRANWYYHIGLVNDNWSNEVIYVGFIDPEIATLFNLKF